MFIFYFNFYWNYKNHFFEMPEVVILFQIKWCFQSPFREVAAACLNK